MAVDQTASVAENIVLKEKLEITFSLDDRKVAIASRLFYEKGFVLFRRCAGENVLALKRDVDYKLVFKVPGLRSADGMYGMFAGIQMLTHEPDAEYFIIYRSVGATATFSQRQLREQFEQNRQISLLSFHALTLPGGAAPSLTNLDNDSINLVGSTIGYETTAGQLERTAEENQITQLVNAVGSGAVDDGGTSDGGMF